MAASSPGKSLDLDTLLDLDTRAPGRLISELPEPCLAYACAPDRSRDCVASASTSAAPGAAF